MQGFLALHRKIRESAVFNDLELYRLWTICLTEASHKEHEILVGRQTVTLQKGQFLTGRFELHKMYHKGLKPKNFVSEKTVWRWLETLQKIENVTINSTNKYSIFTVVNWSFYQGNDQVNDQQVTNKRPTNDQQMTTNNNGNKGKKVKNGNKEKELKTLYAEFVSLTEPEYQKLIDKYGEEVTRRAIEILNNYKGSSGKKYVSDYMTMLNWVFKRIEEDSVKKGGRPRETTGQRNHHHGVRSSYTDDELDGISL